MIGKRIWKMNVPPKQKMEYPYCVNCKKHTGNSHIGSETIDDKVKLLKKNLLSVSVITQCFCNK